MQLKKLATAGVPGPGGGLMVDDRGWYPARVVFDGVGVEKLVPKTRPGEC